MAGFHLAINGFLVWYSDLKSSTLPREEVPLFLDFFILFSLVVESRRIKRPNIPDECSDPQSSD